MDAETIIRRERLKPLLENLDSAMSGLDIRQPSDSKFDSELSISDLRRSRRRGLEDNVEMLTLTEVDGVLQWEEGAGITSGPGRRARRGARVSGDIVAQYKFEKLDPSKVGEFLEKLDDKMSLPRGLRRWDGHQLQNVAAPQAAQRALVFIHGTFSNNDNLFAEIQSSKEGKSLLARSLKHYDEVLAFDHATLSVSPVLNALDLSRLFAGSGAAIDIVCHSRGGLVARWWMEAFKAAAGKQRRVIFVGSPLAGTSLAAPPRLRAALNFITNIGRVLGTVAGAASLAVPFLSVAAGLMKVLTSVTSAGANTPLIDAAVAMIPGIAGQSRVGNAQELLRLREPNGGPLPEYFAVQSNFEPTDSGWAFWKKFVKWKQTLADIGTDLVFESENDLVVDTASMTDLSDNVTIPAARVYDFGTTDRVYHTNYFRQPETIDFISKSFGIQ